MGRILLVLRLAARDLRRRPAQAMLLLVAIVAATTTLTIGLVLHGVTDQPYQATRQATVGPDVVASVAAPPGGSQTADPAGLEALTEAAGVAAFSGPYPYTQTEVGVGGETVTAWAQGRRTAPALVDQPTLTDGTWVRDGGVVLEASFADALGVDAGDPITLDGRSFDVAGVAITAATPPYPKTCLAPCRIESANPYNGPPFEGQAKGAEPPPGPAGSESAGAPPRGAFWVGTSGLIWLTDTDLHSLVSEPESLAYVLHLTLDDPDAAHAFVDAHSTAEPAAPAFATWQAILDGHAKLVENQRTALLIGSWLLSLLALASIAVLIGGRLAELTRRVGLVKAVGGTPAVIAAVLLVEYIIVALLAAAVGLTTGRMTAPLFTSPGSGLLGRAAAVPFTTTTVGLVALVAVGIAVVATLVPAVRASRTSTVLALADAPRPPRRIAWLVAISTRLPTPLLLGLRVAARRPRRTLLGVLASTITVAGVVAALSAHAHLLAEKGPGSDPRTDLGRVLVLISITLMAQAAINAICIAWANALDTRHSSAVARALGAAPHQVTIALSAAQALPTFVGGLVAIPLGIGLAEILDDDPVTTPAPWQLLAVVIGSVLVLATLIAIPALISARRPVTPALQSELA